MFGGTNKTRRKRLNSVAAVADMKALMSDKHLLIIVYPTNNINYYITMIFVSAF
jgi:hypothetical protein